MSPAKSCGVQIVIAIAAAREQKRLEQTDRRNGRISILGVWQPDRSFKYALASGSFKVRKLHRASSIGLLNLHLRLSGQPGG